jgi:plasmid stabilization system protein ParE
VRIRYTPRAFRELQDIFAYIDHHSPLGARNVRSRVHAVLELIAPHPHSGPRIGKRGFRRIAAFPYPYLIFYRVAADEVVILGVRHAARDPSPRRV